MKLISWIWTDDKTGNFSDTTFRTWLSFFLFSACVIYWVWFDPDGLSNREEILVEVMALFCLGQGSLYGFKRFNERKSHANSFTSHFNSLAGQPGNPVYTPESDPAFSDAEKNLKERGL